MSTWTQMTTLAQAPVYAQDLPLSLILVSPTQTWTHLSLEASNKKLEDDTRITDGFTNWFKTFSYKHFLVTITDHF